MTTVGSKTISRNRCGNSGSFAVKEDNFRKINKISEKYLKLTENIVQ
jgi:hypothetical protein